MAIPYNSNYEGTLSFSDVAWQISLQANSEQAMTIPGTSNQWFQVLFSYNDTANVYVRPNITAVIPPLGTTTSLQYQEYRPLKRNVRGGDVLHLITPDTVVYMGLSLRQIQGS